MNPLILFLCSFCLISSVFGQSGEEELLLELRQKIEREKAYPNIDAMIVELGDEIIAEEYYNGFGPDSLHDTRSSFKSITSLLAGIAIDQKLFTLEDQLEKFFPDLKGNSKGEITVRNLLEMKTGLNCEEFYGDGPDCEDSMWDKKDWIKHCLSPRHRYPTGTKWSYSSIPPMLMGEVIARASGMPIMDFAKKNLFQPLNIESYRWTISPKGRGMTAGSFYMRPLDMLKIARLVKQNGVWKGRQVVSAEWIAESTKCNIKIDFPFLKFTGMKNAEYQSATYGFYWYREIIGCTDKNVDNVYRTEVLFASGNGGQYMMLLPEYDAQVVFTGSNYGNWRGKLPFEIVLNYVIPLMVMKDPELQRAPTQYFKTKNEEFAFSEELCLYSDHHFETTSLAFHAGIGGIERGSYAWKDDLLSLHYYDGKKKYFTLVEGKLYKVQEVKTLEEDKKFVDDLEIYPLSFAVGLTPYSKPARSNYEAWEKGRIENFKELIQEYRSDEEHFFIVR